MKTALLLAAIAWLTLPLACLMLAGRLCWQRWRADRRQDRPILRLPYDMAGKDRDSWRHYPAAALRGLKGGGK